jgi:hypothetical protein
MSEDYEVKFHLEDVMPILDTMLAIHRILDAHRIKITDDSEILLSDYRDEDVFELEPITDLHESLKKIANWPALGTLSYWMGSNRVSVGYSKTIEHASVQCVTVFFSDRFFDDQEGQDYLPIMLSMAVDLHHNLRSVRTIWGWGLEAWFGYDWEEEIQRLTRKQIEGLYWLDILRADYVSEERKGFLHNHLGEKSFLKLLSDGSLYYQQTDIPSLWFRA